MAEHEDSEQPEEDEDESRKIVSRKGYVKRFNNDLYKSR